tara:strand:- start:2830 stop:3525 length:696 start_codon:yes stop_codon:yes gene_type:complete
MSRLITFGCSLTQGQALEDGVEYSKLSWPYKLADKLNLECVNRGQNGASAKKIWFNILNFDYQPDDTVVILWTHMDRWCILYEMNTGKIEYQDWDIYPDQKDEYRDTTSKTDVGLKDLNPGLYNEEDKLMLMWYENFHTEIDMTMQYYLHVAHANSWLKNKVSKVYNVKASESNRVAWFNEVPFLETEMDTMQETYPTALDGHHPGALAMEKFAESIYDEMLNENYLQNFS